MRAAVESCKSTLGAWTPWLIRLVLSILLRPKISERDWDRVTPWIWRRFLERQALPFALHSGRAHRQHWPDASKLPGMIVSYCAAVRVVGLTRRCNRATSHQVTVTGLPGRRVSNGHGTRCPQLKIRRLGQAARHSCGYTAGILFSGTQTFEDIVNADVLFG